MPSRTEELDLSEIERMDLAALHRFWRTHLAGDPPSGRAIDLLRHEIAWRLQASRYGELDTATKRVLRKRGATAVNAKTSDVPDSVAAVGTTLAREWRGETHVVKVTADGYFYEGRLHRSLTAIAKHVTGGHWSGPRFFGLGRP